MDPVLCHRHSGTSGDLSLILIDIQNWCDAQYGKKANVHLAYVLLYSQIFSLSEENSVSNLNDTNLIHLSENE